MSWLILIIAGLSEAAFVFCLGKFHQTEGAAARYWFAGFLLCLSVSMFLLVKASRVLPIGTAYAVWTGIGAAATVILGIIVFREPAQLLRLFFLGTLIASIVGLKLVS